MEAIWAFKRYVSYRDSLADPDECISGDFLKTNYEDFYQYCSAIHDYDMGKPDPSDLAYFREQSKLKFQAKLHQANATTSPTVATTTSTLQSKKSPVAEFKKGIKRDPAQFPALTDIARYFEWIDTFTKVAAAQNVDSFLNANFSPTPGSDEEALFNEEKKYINSILPKVFTCKEARTIMREHKGQTDPRVAFEKLKKAVCDSSATAVRMGAVLQDIGTCTWKTTKFRTARAYVEHLFNQLELYNDLAAPQSAQLPDVTMKAQMQRAVADLPALNEVITAETLLAVRDPSKVSTYHEYYGLLIDAADRYDEVAKTEHIGGGQSQKQVYLHDIISNIDHDDNFDLDMTMREYLVNQSARVTADGKVRMDFQSWKAVSPEGKTTWDSLSEEDKATILQVAGKSTAPAAK
jgi:hypothetical protein